MLLVALLTLALLHGGSAEEYGADVSSLVSEAGWSCLKNQRSVTFGAAPAVGFAATFRSRTVWRSFVVASAHTPSCSGGALLPRDRRSGPQLRRHGPQRARGRPQGRRLLFPQRAHRRQRCETRVYLVWCVCRACARGLKQSLQRPWTHLLVRWRRRASNSVASGSTLRPPSGARADTTCRTCSICTIASKKRASQSECEFQNGVCSFR